MPTRPPGYLVKDILKAYNADALTVTGAGQRIAILIDRFPLRPDINYFWTQNGLPTDANRVNLINVKNVVLLLPDDGEEVGRSGQVACSGCKDLGLRSGSLEFVDLDLALDRILADAIADPQLRQLSVSLGLGEQLMSPDGTLTGEVDIENTKFIQLAALGVNVFVSSGDGSSGRTSTANSVVKTAPNKLNGSPQSVGGWRRWHDSTGEADRRDGQRIGMAG